MIEVDEPDVPKGLHDVLLTGGQSRTEDGLNEAIGQLIQRK
ncbi:hypothetical protein [Glacieibacterium frigidum]|nr:hypothetical protein [Glacieibacterium frigidum]